MNVIPATRTLSLGRASVGLACIAASGLGLQVVLTRLFSLLIWHHFTYLIVGTALLGGGAAGTLLTVRRIEPAVAGQRAWLPAALLSLSILVTLAVVCTVGADPLQRTAPVRTVLGLGLHFTVLFVTFFLSGAAIALVFLARVGDAARLYCADLCGAASCMVLILVALRGLGGPAALAALALLALIGAWSLLPQAAAVAKVALAILAVVELGAVIILAVTPVALPIPKSKALHFALALSGVNVPEVTVWNPIARVDVMPPVTVQEPMLVGGVSRRFLESSAGRTYELRLLTLDGTSMTGIHKASSTDFSAFDFLQHAVASAVYQIGRNPASVLCIGVGGGLDVQLALRSGARSVTAIEVNSDVVHLLAGRFAAYSGALATRAGVKLLAAEGRNFISRDERTYDVVQGIGVDNITALSSGVYVFTENYLYTVEALEAALSRLGPNGVYSWTLSDSVPSRTVIRLAGLAAEALSRQGRPLPASHLAIVGNESRETATVLMSRRPFDERDMAQLRSWAQVHGFPVLHDPLLPVDTEHARYLTTSDRAAFQRDYPFRITPVTDDAPFFYNFFRWSRFSFGGTYKSGGTESRPLANLVVATMMGVTMIAAFVCIVLPLRRLGTDHAAVLRSAGPTVAYFCALGVGFIVVELILVQNFTLLVGSPALALTVTLGTLLSSSGFGSLASPRFVDSVTRLRLVLVVIVVGVVGAAVALPAIMAPALRLPDAGRVLTSMIIILPLGVLMGMPFPTGLRWLGEERQVLVPWAWGLNGVFSVLGSVGVITVGATAGLTAAFYLAAAAYAVAALVCAAAFHETRATSAIPALTARERDVRAAVKI